LSTANNAPQRQERRADLNHSDSETTKEQRTAPSAQTRPIRPYSRPEPLCQLIRSLVGARRL